MATNSACCVPRLTCGAGQRPAWRGTTAPRVQPSQRLVNESRLEFDDVLTASRCLLGEEVDAVFKVERHDRGVDVGQKPAWWLLYAINFLLVGAVGILERTVPAGPLRTVLECLAVIIALGLMLLWRRCNRARWA